MSERRKHEPVTLSAGEVALLADLIRGMPDDEIENLRGDVRGCLPVFVPAGDREQAAENFRRLGLL